MQKIQVLILLLFLTCQAALSSVIEGQNKEYAGKTIDFFRYSDPVTRSKEPVFSIHFGTEGSFKEEVQITKTTFVFCDFEIFHGMMFLEPGKSITPVFPPFRERSFADQKNPYFEPVSFWFRIENDNGLNKKISDFDAKFNQLTDQYFNELYFRQSNSAFETVKNELNNEFPESTVEYFEIHKNLKIDLLKSEVFRQNAETTSRELSEIPEKFWTISSFIEIFNKTFTNRLSFDTKEPGGSEIIKSVAQGDINFLLNFIKEKYKLKDKMATLALLKMLHDGYYSSEFPKTSILKLLNSEKLTGNPDEYLREITENIKGKLTFLQPGTKAPVICLNNISGNRKCTNENSGKFKYLIFADEEMMVCREQLKYLTKTEDLFQNQLEIILVMRNSNLAEMKSFFNANKIPGEKLIDTNGEYNKKYEVRAFPACFLLDENHHVAIDNVKAPLDGFEQQFRAFLQQENIKNLRNQSK